MTQHCAARQSCVLFFGACLALLPLVEAIAVSALTNVTATVAICSAVFRPLLRSDRHARRRAPAHHQRLTVSETMSLSGTMEGREQRQLRIVSRIDEIFVIEQHCTHATAEVFEHAGDV